MRALFIGGTGTISAAVSALAIRRGWELFLLNRGHDMDRVPKGARLLRADIRNEAEAAARTAGMHFDVVADFIAFEPAQVERDIRLFSGRTDQYIFISSASAYQKPPRSFHITEKTPLSNPCWQYSRDKIACEERLSGAYRSAGFPVTVVRPSHTYDERKIPVAVHGARGSWQVIERIRRGKPVPVLGDGASLWVLTWSRDFARGFVGLMGNASAVGESFQLTSDEVLTWDAIYDAIGRAWGREPVKLHVPSDFLAECAPELRGGLLGDKSHSVCFDNAKIRRLVPDFTDFLPFEEGVRRCADYLRQHPELQVPDPAFDRFCDRLAAARETALRAFHAGDGSLPV